MALPNQIPRWLHTVGISFIVREAALFFFYGLLAFDCKHRLVVTGDPEASAFVRGRTANMGMRLFPRFP